MTMPASEERRMSGIKQGPLNGPDCIFQKPKKMSYKELTYYVVMIG